MTEDLAQLTFRPSSMMDHNDMAMYISVLYHSKLHNSFYISRPGKSDVEVPSHAPSAYNKALKHGLIPLDNAHPATQMMSRALDIDPDKTLIGVFMKPS
jgi:hypothetical protein